MKNKNKVLRVAEFNPKIKTYLLLTVAMVLLLTIFGIPIMIIWFLGLGQYYTRRYYKGLHCRLTERHLEFKKGVLFRVEKTIPLENIQDLTFIDNPLLQWLDLRILKIETAGQSNPQGSDMKLMGIRNTTEFKEAVLEQRENLQNEKRSEVPRTSEPQEGALMNVLNEIKELLEDIRNNSR